jgi:hypothetical protein
MAEILYNAMVVFCNHFIDIRSRTHDQMVQAAIDGNLLEEGYRLVTIQMV